MGYYEKVISCECGKQHGEGRCQKYFECNYEIVEKLHEVRPNDADENVSNVIRKAVRPDIIVHNRNKGGIEMCGQREMALPVGGGRLRCSAPAC